MAFTATFLPMFLSFERDIIDVPWEIGIQQSFIFSIVISHDGQRKCQLTVDEEEEEDMKEIEEEMEEIEEEDIEEEDEKNE